MVDDKNIFVNVFQKKTHESIAWLIQETTLADLWCFKHYTWLIALHRLLLALKTILGFPTAIGMGYLSSQFNPLQLFALLPRPWPESQLCSNRLRPCGRGWPWGGGWLVGETSVASLKGSTHFCWGAEGCMMYNWCTRCVHCGKLTFWNQKWRFGRVGRWLSSSNRWSSGSMLISQGLTNNKVVLRCLVSNRLYRSVRSVLFCSNRWFSGSIIFFRVWL